MPDYSNTVIYKIICKDSNITDIYIGSTINFKRRKIEHKYSCNNENDKRYNLKVYQYIRENGGWDNFEMVIIEKYPCNDIYKAIEREGYFVKELKASLNNNIPGRTDKEWYLDNKKNCAEYRKEYRIINNEKIKEKEKEFRINNKEKIKNEKKIYYLNNKNEINEKRKEIITCECGCKIRKDSLKKHKQTIKHINLMSNK
jgi:hypothetical protein